MELIQAKCLRIGNCVWAEIGLPSLNTHKIVANDFVGIDNGENQVYGIPLDKEWLTRLGFEMRGDTGQYFINEYTVSTGDRFLLWHDSDSFGVACEYVHQLQNAYFVFTQHELAT